MKFVVWFVLSIVSCLPATAQGTIAKEIGDLIQKGNLEEAEARVASYLAKDPHNVDAMMMKGNILLNKSPVMKEGIVVAANDDESIYSSSIGYVGGSQPSVIPKDLAIQVANIWKEALTFDNSREDIHFGICQIYSMAILTDELVSYLPTLKANIHSDPVLHFSMGDYARNMIAREHFIEGMKVYKEIWRLYPEQCGLLSDIAGEYYQHGDLDSAQTYAHKVLSSANLDSMSYGNAFFILAACEDYDGALKAITLESVLTGDKNFLMYQGLLQYSRADPHWASTLQAFLKASDDSVLTACAQTLLSLDHGVSHGDYLKLSGAQLNDGYSILLHRTFKKMLPTDPSPWLNYAEVLTHTHSYQKAAREWFELESSSLLSDSSDIESVAFYYGWVLWRLDRREASIAEFAKLLRSGNFYYRSAAAYFNGRYRLDRGEHEKAREYFEIVSDRAKESKYATLCWNLLQR